MRVVTYCTVNKVFILFSEIKAEEKNSPTLYLVHVIVEKIHNLSYKFSTIICKSLKWLCVSTCCRQSSRNPVVFCPRLSFGSAVS